MTKRRNRNEPLKPTSPPITAEEAKATEIRSRQLFVIGAVLVIITLIAFWEVRSNSFINVDDDIYITKNARVQAGLTWDNIKWAFSTTYFGFYYPLTWLSHMLDCELYGLKAGGHHITSLMIHILNVLILFMVFFKMTGARWRSALVAALFAVHPLHVESVAWVAERKDVLSTFFWFSCLLAYVFYAEKPSFKRYSLVFLAFLFGLMTKSMLVTLPFTLLLLDYWPLKRWSPFQGKPEEGGVRQPTALKRLLWEKLPLFAMVPVFAFITISAQKQANAVASFNLLPLTQRAANALISYIAYLKKAFLPVDLAFFYPLSRDRVSIWLAAICGLMLVIITIAALWYGRKRKYLAAGWLWYLGVLVPVIGFIQIGGQAMADRYTYVSLTGIFLMIVWGLAEIAERNPLAVKSFFAAAALVLVVLVGLTRAQVRCWADSVTLFEHTLAVTSDNQLAHNNLGVVLYLDGKKDEAMAHFAEAVRIDPAWFDAQYNLGNSLAEKGKYVEAIEHYQESITANPDHADVRFNLGGALMVNGQLDAAIEQYRQAVRIDPGSGRSFYCLGLVLAETGQMNEAIDSFRETVRIEPDSFDARTSLGDALADIGQRQESIEQYKQALRIRPGSARVLTSLGLALAKSGDISEAIGTFKEAIRNEPDYADAYINLGYALLQKGDAEEAVKNLRQALKLDPDSKLALGNLQQAEKALRERRK